MNHEPTQIPKPIVWLLELMLAGTALFWTFIAGFLQGLMR